VAKLAQQAAELMPIYRSPAGEIAVPGHALSFRVFGVFRGFNCFSGCRRKKWRGFGNFVPEFFIDAEARDGRISRLVHNFI
jgi:hypothetical protein